MLLISFLVTTIDLIMTVTGSIWLLFATLFMGGITAATTSTASAFIAYIFKLEKKSANYYHIGAACEIGVVLGPISGLFDEFGTHAPFCVTATVGIANLSLGY